ncbi:MAG: hypothetical protein HC903_24640 [Methylacidiphilales bacterium]|nr:hypothetical protein [Candidatus Methylacidiphilales bacterium]NJR18986.1 hypothetical protein [Calothrix sp. CSU_2_0]
MLDFESFILLYLLLLPLARIAFVAWLYLKTKNLVVFTYLVYLVLDVVLRDVIERRVAKFIDKTQNSETPKWLGKEPEKRSSNALSLVKAIEGTIQLIFLMSLLYALLIFQFK